MFINGLSLGAQQERENISIRTKAGLDRKRTEGVNLGRPGGSLNKVHKLDPFKDQIAKSIMIGIPLKRIAKDNNVTQQTLIIFIKRHNLKEIKKINRKPKE